MTPPFIQTDSAAPVALAVLRTSRPRRERRSTCADRLVPSGTLTDLLIGLGA